MKSILGPRIKRKAYRNIERMPYLFEYKVRLLKLLREDPDMEDISLLLKRFKKYMLDYPKEKYYKPKGLDILDELERVYRFELGFYVELLKLEQEGKLESIKVFFNTDSPFKNFIDVDTKNLALFFNSLDTSLLSAYNEANASLAYISEKRKELKNLDNIAQEVLKKEFRTILMKLLKIHKENKSSEVPQIKEIREEFTQIFAKLEKNIRKESDLSLSFVLSVLGSMPLLIIEEDFKVPSFPFIYLLGVFAINHYYDFFYKCMDVFLNRVELGGYKPEESFKDRTSIFSEYRTNPLLRHKVEELNVELSYFFRVLSKMRF